MRNIQQGEPSNQNLNLTIPLTNEIQEQQAPPKVRIQSLDVYRGLTMVGMILVDCMGPTNNPPWFLEHAEWNGLTPADLIFPAFLFIMGMAIPLAVTQNKPLRLKNIVRIFALFLIGFFLNLLGKKFNFDVVRIPGILQRLSVCYAVVLFVHVSTGLANKHRHILGSLFMSILLLIYFSYMFTFQSSQISCIGESNLSQRCNFAGYIDQKVFTPHHMLKNVHTDPQGLISTIPAAFTTYMGYFFCLLMKEYRGNNTKILTGWIIISAIFGALVYPMTELMPLNKKLYSISFTLIVVAISGASLSFFYLVIDILPTFMPTFGKVVRVIQSPFKWLGMNPLIVFFLMDVVVIIMAIYIKIDNKSLYSLFFKHAFKTWISDETVAAGAFASFFAIFWTIIAGILYKYKIFIKL